MGPAFLYDSDIMKDHGSDIMKMDYGTEAWKDEGMGSEVMKAPHGTDLMKRHGDDIMKMSWGTEAY